MSARITASPFGAALALTVTAVSAAEDTYSANFMLPHCRDAINRNAQGNPYVQGVCAGILHGIFLMGSMARAMDQVTRSTRPVRTTEMDFMQRGLCIDLPDGATLEQSVRVVVAYIDARPARMNEPFAGLALEALRTAWP